MVKRYPPGKALSTRRARPPALSPTAPVDAPWIFVLSGGALCLDFVNTISWRQSPHPTERLTSYRRLVSWAEQAGAVTSLEGRRLLAAARLQPHRAVRARARAVTLRETVFAIFDAGARGRPIPRQAVGRLNEFLADALMHRRVVPSGASVGWSWTAGSSLDRMLWPVAVSAADLLTSRARRRVRLCASDTCGWIFLDTSRNRSRRWCTMEVCGNRAKVRRHYYRSRRPHRREPSA